MALSTIKQCIFSRKCWVKYPADYYKSSCLKNFRLPILCHSLYLDAFKYNCTKVFKECNELDEQLYFCLEKRSRMRYKKSSHEKK